MDCNDIKPRLEACVMGRLSGEEKSAVEAHFATCEGCRLELELARAVLGSPAGDSAPSLSPSPPRSETLSLAPIEPEPEPSSHVEPSAVHLPQLSSAPEADANISAADLETSFEDVASSAGASHGHVGAAGGAKSQPAKKARWGFEPAEPPREAPPPEKSLFFAEEALARKEKPNEPGPKLPVRRLVMWSGGALLGMGLLAVSVWMALASHEAPPNAGTLAARTSPSKPSAPSGSTLNPAMSTAQQGASTTTQAPPASTPNPSPTPAQLAAGTPASVVSPATGAPPSASTPQSKGPTPPSSSAGGPTSASVVTTTPCTKPMPASSSPVPFVTKIKTPAKPEHDDMADDFKTDPEAEPPRDAEVVHVPLTKHAGGGFQATSHAAANSANSEGATAPAQTPKSSESETPTIAGPIDRLHLATEHATKSSDLDALRRLKVTWKNFIHTSTGPDRARAKREYADCLWGIQAATGRDSDRREALAAYREYVLNAPAGGSDTRTVDRMRTLEDALSESK